MIRRLLILALLVGAVAAVTTWPRINDVETGRTPEYPDVKVREYAPSQEAVTRAAQEALARLPRFTLVGSGSGPRGSEVQAVATTRIFQFKDDVTIRIWREGRRTRVSVRSRSRIGKWDFGQNARNIRELLTELDRQIERVP